MNLSKKQKQQLRKIFRDAQDILMVENLGEGEEFCCHALDIAQGLKYGGSEANKTLAFQYFAYLFRPSRFDCVWFCFNDQTKNKDQICRLMALQLCELSLS